MKKIKKFKDKKVTIRFLEQADIKKAEKFKKYINELVDDDTALIKIKNRKSLKEEREWIKEQLKKIKKHQAVMFIVEYDGEIIGTAAVFLKPESQDHIGEFGITVLKDYRSMGLGKYLMKEILKLAEKELKPKPRIIRLGVFSTNKVAISLYEKFGFKIVAKIPKQFNFSGKLIDEFIMLKSVRR